MVAFDMVAERRFQQQLRQEMAHGIQQLRAETNETPKTFLVAPGTPLATSNSLGPPSEIASGVNTFFP